MTDPTLWRFILAEQRDTQEQSDTGNTTLSSGTGTKDEIITAVCTIFAFILGVICGLIAYHCASSLVKRKAAASQGSEQQSTAAASLSTDKSGNVKRVHYKKSVKADPEPSIVYDEVTPHYSRPGMHNVHVKVSENVAYGQL